MRKHLLAACEAITTAQPKRAPDYTACGKEILRDGEHFADMATPGAAIAAAIMFNRGVLVCQSVNEAEMALLREELWG